MTGFNVPMPDGATTPMLDTQYPPGDPRNEEQTSTGKPKMIEREEGEVADPRAALVKKILEGVQRDKRKWDYAFKRMKKDMAYSRRGAEKSWSQAGRYTANIIQRHIQQRVASLYAKNPKFTARAAPRLCFKVWDGSPQSLSDAINGAIQMDPLTAAPIGINPEAVSIITDALEGLEKRKLYKKLAQTLELFFAQQLRDQPLPVKKQFKQLVRRIIGCGIGYVKLGFERELEYTADTTQRIATAEQRMATVRRLMADLHDEEKTEHDAEMEQLRVTLEGLRKEPTTTTHEGIVFDFPASTAIIPDERCTNILTFKGCRRVTEQFMLSVDDVKEIYNKDLSKGSYTPFRDGKLIEGGKDESDAEVCVYHVYNKKDGLVYVVAEGHKDFLEEPSPPKYRLERFWPWFPLAFNEIEDEEDPFPPSDVALLRPMQEEYNKARQGLREHRRAARPKMAVSKGANLSDDDKTNLKKHPAMALIEMDGLGPQQKVEDLLQVIKTPMIDQALYDVEPVFTDVLRTTGVQEANLGGTSGSTATEASIAEGSRVSSTDSCRDDLDDMLTELARAAGQLLLAECSEDTVKKAVGEGATWPELSAEEISTEIFLEVEAGSSGRPNKAQEVQNFRELAPVLERLPGIQPEMLAREGVRRLDDKLDVDEWVTAGMPAITVLNKIAEQAMQIAKGQAAAGAAPLDGGQPEDQAAAGAENMELAPGSEMTPAGGAAGVMPAMGGAAPGVPMP